MDFAKMHGAGNDFIMIDDIDNSFDPSPELISSLCHRNLGIGADGLILIRPSENADFRMLYYNRDGSRAEMCGNGARCAARFAYLRSIADESMSFETDSGLVMAEAGGEEVAVTIGEVNGLRTGIRLSDSGLECSYAVSGVPHAVVFVESVKDMPYEEVIRLGKEIRSAPQFEPAGTNVNFVSVVDEKKVLYRTYERGVEDETLACGTGAAAVAVISGHLGMTNPPVVCVTRGGDSLTVDFEMCEDGGSNCSLKGPAVVVFEGKFQI